MQGPFFFRWRSYSLKTQATPQRGPEQRTCVPFISITERSFIQMSYSSFALNGGAHHTGGRSQNHGGFQFSKQS